MMLRSVSLALAAWLAATCAAPNARAEQAIGPSAPAQQPGPKPDLTDPFSQRVWTAAPSVLGRSADATDLAILNANRANGRYPTIPTQAQIEDALKRAQTMRLYAQVMGEQVIAPSGDRHLIDFPLGPHTTSSQAAAIERLMALYPLDDVEHLREAFGDASVLMVGSGEETDGEPTPPPIPNGGGATGLNGGDYLYQELPLSPDGLHIAVQYNASRFAEVGVLTRRDGGDDLALCTASRIAPRWIITAAHCVVTRGANDRAILQSTTRLAYFPNNEAGTAAFWTRLYAPAGQDGSRGRRITNRQRLCAVAVAPRVWSSSQTPLYDDVIANDVALVEISDSDIRRLDSSLLDPTPNTLVTFAGYGQGQAAGGERGDPLRIGWGRSARPGEPRPPGDLSGICPGDSGGPIYAGLRQGRSTEKRTQVGVMSRSECHIGSLHIIPVAQAYFDQATLNWIASTIRMSSGRPC